ncbi:hypothetical protein C8R42DRAFT_641981 [Lentinula raphanica]|nr:hypothetical protein C8R42DRAFT_641981 [Lentinula raphanica]
MSKIFYEYYMFHITETARRHNGDSTKTQRRQREDSAKTQRRHNGDSAKTQRRLSGDSTKTQWRQHEDSTTARRLNDSTKTQQRRCKLGSRTFFCPFPLRWWLSESTKKQYFLKPRESLAVLFSPTKRAMTASPVYKAAIHKELKTEVTGAIRDKRLLHFEPGLGIRDYPYTHRLTLIEAHEMIPLVNPSWLISQLLKNIDVNTSTAFPHVSMPMRVGYIVKVYFAKVEVIQLLSLVGKWATGAVIGLLFLERDHRLMCKVFLATPTSVRATPTPARAKPSLARALDTALAMSARPMTDQVSSPSPPPPSQPGSSKKSLGKRKEHDFAPLFPTQPAPPSKVDPSTRPVKRARWELAHREYETPPSPGSVEFGNYLDILEMIQKANDRLPSSSPSSSSAGRAGPSTLTLVAGPSTLTLVAGPSTLTLVAGPSTLVAGPLTSTMNPVAGPANIFTELNTDMFHFDAVESTGHHLRYTSAWKISLQTNGMTESTLQKIVRYCNDYAIMQGLITWKTALQRIENGTP